MLHKLLQTPLDDIKSGFSYNTESKKYSCLICGKEYENGEIFSFDGRLFEASKAIQLHMKTEHENMLAFLTGFDKKVSGITDNQKEIMMMLYEGLSDNEIAGKTGVAPATIRHQRFVFREKAKQAKLYLAIFEVLEEATSSCKNRKSTSDDLIDVHSGAKMVDDRYIISKSEEEKIMAAAFESLQPLKLKSFSPKEKKKIVILRKIAEQFEKGKRYSEKELNAVLKTLYDDFATIRRYLIEYGFMERTNDCREYWLK